MVPVLMIFFLWSCSDSSTTYDNSSSSLQDAECDGILSQARAELGLSSSWENRELWLASRILDTLSNFVPSGIKFVFVPKSGGVGENRSVYFDINFFWESIPLCETYGRFHEDLSSISGKIPQSSWGKPQISHWPELPLEALEKIHEILPNFKLRDQEKCLSYRKGYIPFWRLDLEDEQGLPYRALVHGYEKTLDKLEPSFFSVDGRATIYTKTQSLDYPNDFKDISLTSLTSGGRLCEARFSTSIPSSWKEAFDSSHVYSYPKDDNRFLQTSAFANIKRHADWFMSLPDFSKTWPGPHLLISMVPLGDRQINNPHYTPTTGKVLPQITLGPGDGKSLMNLMIDEDVVFHELGHHVIYQHITRTTGASLVLHEGIADFFTQMHTKNSKLGSWICPQGGTICAETNALRNAQNTLNFFDNQVSQMSPHRKSQVISGFLWDLCQIIGNEEQTANLVIKGLTYVPKDAGYVDFVQGLLQADQILYQGKYQTNIQNLSQERGLVEANDY